MNTKQVIVLRKDLKMRKGKMVSQGAHASMKVILDMMVRREDDAIVFDRYYSRCLPIEKNSALEDWINGIFTKVTCGVDSLIELEELYQKALDSRIPCSKIVDAGKTEFNGVPTVTAIAIGPAESEKIDKITGNLKLL